MKAQTQLLFPIGKVAEIEIVYRTQVKNSERLKITSSMDAAEAIRPIYQEIGIEHREHMFVLYVNHDNRIIATYHIGSGGVGGVACDPKLIFQGGLMCNASGLILVHNHPSGNIKPSPADIALTKRVALAGALLGMQVLDHIILTDDSYLSIADEGLMPSKETLKALVAGAKIEA